MSQVSNSSRSCSSLFLDSLSSSCNVDDQYVVLNKTGDEVSNTPSSERTSSKLVYNSRANNYKVVDKTQRSLGWTISATIGVWIPTLIHNLLILLGLYSQSFTLITLLCLAESFVLKNYNLDVLGFRWIPRSTSRNHSSGTLENIERYYKDQKNKYSDDSIQFESGSPASASKMKHSPSDEWGYFADFGEVIELRDTDLRHPSSSEVTLPLMTVHEIDDHQHEMDYELRHDITENDEVGHDIYAM